MNLATLLEQDRYMIVKFTGTVGIRSLLQRIRVHLKYVLPEDNLLSYRWYNTSTGYVVAVGANRLKMSIIKDYIATHRGKFYDEYSIIHESHGAKKFQKALAVYAEMPSRGSRN